MLEAADDIAGGIDRDELAVDQLNGADMIAAIGDEQRTEVNDAMWITRFARPSLRV
jgi:hypothetical protein